MSDATHPGIDQSKARLRDTQRAQRRSLGADQQRHAANRLCRRIADSNLFASAQSVAFYMPSDGEISLLPLIELARARGKLCLLPALNHQTLVFKEHNDKLIENQFGIPEPAQDYTYPPWVIDLVLMPMVAFDRNHNRLGMGGGYYDRTFAYLKGPGASEHAINKPVLLGVAHEQQRVAEVPHDDNDLQPDHIATDAAWH